ncbi:MAG: type II secretion system F family protein [Dehalococcoidales bacterium]|nr:type II secretion system F family protein [Dehalococcoidales bacterium]
MLYQYVACGESGDIVKGKISATSEDAITQMLGYAGYRLINLRPYVPFLSLGKLTAQLFPVKENDIIMLYRQLALLLESGINIVTSLELLQEQITNHTLKKVVHDVINDIRNGDQLSTAMSRHPNIFSTMSCRTLSIGEQTGGLETMLKQVADYMEKEIATRKGIKGALMYPMIAAVVTVVVVGILMLFVLPAFADLYGSLGAELPALTRIMIAISGLLRAYVLHIFLIIFIVIGLGLIYFRTSDGKYKFDTLILRIPLLGRVKHLNEIARFCRSISLLYTAGLPLTEIMPLVIQGCNNRVMAQALYNVQIDMLKGEGLSKPMAKNPLFLPMMVQMVKVGEETGTLDASLLAVAQNYETEAQDKTKSLIAMIQPIMTVIIAGIVGLIAISMVSAMYSMYGQDILTSG